MALVGAACQSTRLHSVSYGGTADSESEGIMKPLFKLLFFACGWIGLMLNLVFVVVSFLRDAPIETSAIETALELVWVGGVTFFGLGALVLGE
ncbi:hypothetical protein Q3C01_35550 [Bradyrhizobium sp. UFLA05-109]